MAQENVLPMEASSRVLSRHDNNIGTILVEEGRLSLTEVDRIMELHSREGLRFGDAAQRLGLVNEDDVQAALARQYDLSPRLPGNDGASQELVAAHLPYHPRTEELRALRTQLLIRWFRPEAGRQVLAVVSPGSGEGRSYMAANLAVVFSQIGVRTLLIDADLRKPRQHRIFNVSDRKGLAAVLAGRANNIEAAVPVPGFSKLSLLPAGALPPNPQELLSRSTLTTLLKQLQSEFDVVLIDTPASGLYSDAKSVTFRAGSAVVLARRNHTRVADTTNLLKELTDTGTHIVGTVINSF